MSRFYDEDDFDDDDYDDDNFDEYDTGLGGLGDIVNYTSYTPPAPTTPYNTVSNDERAYGSVQQPAKEFSIWDSVAKPGKKVRTPTHSTTRRTSTKKKPHTSSRSVASSNRSNSEFISPVIEPEIINDTQAIHRPEPAQGIDSQSLLVLGGIALVLVLLMRGN
jgi:hypothetical protein